MRSLYQRDSRCRSPLSLQRAAAWKPEEAARYELAILHGLAADKKAQRVYLQKLRIVEAVRAKARQQQVQLHGSGSTRAQAQPSTGAGGRSSGSPGQPFAADTEPRVRRRKSEAQQLKSIERLQHK